jgi:hypothetical protein
VDILCVQETKWMGQKAKEVEDTGFKLWYTGGFHLTLSLRRGENSNLGLGPYALMRCARLPLAHRRVLIV